MRGGKLEGAGDLGRRRGEGGGGKGEGRLVQGNPQ